jgi:hypothetical protein
MAVINFNRLRNLFGGDDPYSDYYSEDQQPYYHDEGDIFSQSAPQNTYSHDEGEPGPQSGVSPQTRAIMAQTQAQGQDQTDTSPDYYSEWMKGMKEQYHPSTRASDAFNQFLSEYPQQESPGLGRKFVASLMAAGQGGYAEADKFLNEPYMRDVQAWKDRAQPMYEAAQAENTANQNERQLLSGVITNAINQRKADLQNATANRKIAETERSNMAREDVARMNAESLDYVRRNPLDKFDLSGPYAMVLHPDGTVEKTNIETGKLSDLTKITLQNAGRAAAAQIAADASKYGADKRLQGVEDTNAARANKPKTPKEIHDEAQLKMEMYYRSNSPYAQFIQNNGDGTFSLKDGPTEPSGFMGFGPSDQSRSQYQQDLKTYSDLLSELYGVKIPTGNKSQQQQIFEAQQAQKARQQQGPLPQSGPPPLTSPSRGGLLSAPGTSSSGSSGGGDTGSGIGPAIGGSNIPPQIPQQGGSVIENMVPLEVRNNPFAYQQWVESGIASGKLVRAVDDKGQTRIILNTPESLAQHHNWIVIHR